MKCQCGCGADDQETVDGVLRIKARQRYHGRVDRGPPPKAALDDQTLRWLHEELGKAKAGMDLVRGDAFASRPKSERKAAERQALAHVELVRRFCEEVLERNHYQEQIDRMVPG